MRRVITALAVAATLFCTGCSVSYFRENEATTQAIEACQEKVADFAKYPAGVEFPEPIDPSFERADGKQGPSGTEFYSVNLNSIAHFPNGFGVPVEYVYSCVTYHDGSGNLLSVQAKANEKRTVLDSINYSPEDDELLD